jgi:hypothetical protein
MANGKHVDFVVLWGGDFRQVLSNDFAFFNNTQQKKFLFAEDVRAPMSTEKRKKKYNCLLPGPVSSTRVSFPLIK